MTHIRIDIDSAPDPPPEKPVGWLGGAIRSPPFSKEARREAGFLLGMLQKGELLGMPRSRPMPSIGPRCHELRVRDDDHDWRIVYRIDPEAILILEVFAKKTRGTPWSVIENCRRRLGRYVAERGPGG